MEEGINKADILVRLKEILLDFSSIEVSESHDVRDIHGLDSLDMVEFVMKIEKEFDITFTDDEMISTKTVEEFIDLTVDKLK